MLNEVSAITYAGESKRPIQRLRISVQPVPDALGRYNEKPNFFDVFIYGEKEIAEAWAGHNDKHPSKFVTVQAQLVGRLKADATGKLYNNITLRLKKITFND
jgi:hypothetical protein